MLIKFVVPALRVFPDNLGRETTAAQAVARRVGMELIQEKKAEVSKACSSFSLPGMTSFGTAYGLFALAQAQDVQQKLRDELLGVQTEETTMNELNALPYLDAVVREILRVHAPVRATGRIAAKDNIIPLSIPITDRYGWTHDHYKIDKGTDVTIPIQSLNIEKALWGDDAAEFKPERWQNSPEAVQGIPGVWGNMLTFLGGPRACIGYRFVLVEMKAFLFTLIREFVFELAIPAEDIIKKSAIVQRPYIKGKVDQGSQLPLPVKLYQRV